MIYDQELKDQIAVYVTRLFDKFQTADLLYHNLDHTHQVVERSKEISLHYSLDGRSSFILDVASWFHDCGHLFGPAEGHEERSNSIMREYLQTMGVEKNMILFIEQCIRSTHFPYQPMSHLAEILCDADSYHLGTNEFLITDELVKKETEIRTKLFFPDWDERTLSMMEIHHYFTPYCQSLLNAGKQKNIDLTRARIKW